jgi:acyl-CoA reductase-like NAD-dependent aldehyde dehydrogenase
MDISLLIDGEDRPASTGRTYDRRDPFTEELASRAAAASLDDVAAAIRAASSAFPAWSKTGPLHRRTILLKAADIMDAKVAEFTQLMIEETGATAPWAGFNVMLAANILREAASMTTQISGEVIPSENPERWLWVSGKPPASALPSRHGTHPSFSPPAPSPCRSPAATRSSSRPPNCARQPTA